MRQAGTGLFREKGKSTGEVPLDQEDTGGSGLLRARRISALITPKEISALRTELVFRELPG